MTDQVERLTQAIADRYTIERELGSGGMATVYLAEDIKHRRKVAVKVLRTELSRNVGAIRFNREIRVAAQLNHPHILSVHDSGEANGFLYYVMPYVEGESLRQKMDREGPLPIEVALRIMRDVAGALSYAHSMGLVHRDVKPENILLHHDEAMIADFGIATAVAGSLERLTESGLAVGTPLYMSPEQAGAEKAIDGRSDIYSVACVLYEMLIGEPPFTGSNVQMIISRHAVDEVRPMRSVRATVPEYVEEAVRKALAKVPADRFGTGTEFAEALDGMGVAPRRPRPSWAPRTRARPVLVALLALATFIGLAVVVRGFSHEQEPLPAIPIAMDDARVLTLDGRSYEPRVSPDGTMLAYVRRPFSAVEILAHIVGAAPLNELNDGVPSNELTVVDLLTDEKLVVAIAPTIGNIGWDPGGARLLYTASNGIGDPDVLMSVSRLGGTPSRILDRPLGHPHSVAYHPMGDTIALSRRNNMIEIMSLDRGATTRTLSAGEDIDDVRALAWSPDGAFLALSLYDYPETHSVRIIAAANGLQLATAPAERLRRMVWSRTSDSVFFFNLSDSAQWRRGSMLSMHLRRDGATFSAPHFVGVYVPWLNTDDFDLDSRTNRMFLLRATTSSDVWLAKRDSLGQHVLQRLNRDNRSYRVEAISPDGDRVAFVLKEGGTEQLFVQDITTPQAASAISLKYEAVWGTNWSTDGSKIAFITRSPGADSFAVVITDGERGSRVRRHEFLGRWNWDMRLAWFQDNRGVIVPQNWPPLRLTAIDTSGAKIAEANIPINQGGLRYRSTAGVVVEPGTMNVAFVLRRSGRGDTPDGGLWSFNLADSMVSKWWVPSETESQQITLLNWSREAGIAVASLRDGVVEVMQITKNGTWNSREARFSTPCSGDIRASKDFRVLACGAESSQSDIVQVSRPTSWR